MKTIWPSVLVVTTLLASGCQTTRKGPTPTPYSPPAPIPVPVALTPVPQDSPYPHLDPNPPPQVAPGVIQQVQFVTDPSHSVPEPLPSATIAQPIPQPLTLVDLEQMALVSNPSVGQAAAQVQMARGNWVQVGLPPNPSVGYEGQQLGSQGRAEQHGVFVSQEFVRGGKLGLNREVAAQEIYRADHHLAAQQQRVLTDVRIAFYNVLIAQRQENLASGLRSIASENLAIAEALLKAEQASRNDTIQAQIELENAEIFTVNAMNRRAAAWETLVTAVGRPDLALQQLDGDLDNEIPSLRHDEVLQRLLSSSPEIAAAMANIERARWAAERARVEKTPNVTVQGLVNWRDNGIGGRSDGALMAGVPLPIWNRNQGALFQAQYEAAAAERALERLELDLRNRLAPVFERYSNALNQVTRYRTRILPAAQESLDNTRRIYQAGEIGFVNLLTVQRTYAQTHLDYLDSLRQLREATVTIEGLLLSNSLKAGDQML